MKNGFTLVELLAVIVILSVLALVATISTSKIIKNTRNELNDVQIKTLEQAAQAYVLKEAIGMFYDDYTNRTCVDIEYLKNSGYLSEQTIKDINKEQVLSGSFKIKYIANQFTYEYQEDKCGNYDKGFICEAVKTSTLGNVPNGSFNLGDEYLCEVKSGVKYTFYIVSTEEDSINLIMDQNINSDGTPAGITGIVKNGDTIEGGYSMYNLVGWYSSLDTSYGPQTALQFLYNATKDWTYIDPLNYTYEPVKFVSVDGIAKINNSTFLGNGLLRARLPIYSSVEGQSEVLKKNDSNEYLHSNLSNASRMFGYWTFTPYNSEKVWIISYTGNIITNSANASASYGVRPVINVRKKAILDK